MLTISPFLQFLHDLHSNGRKTPIKGLYPFNSKRNEKFENDHYWEWKGQPFHSLPGVINIKFPLQPSWRYYSHTVWRTWVFLFLQLNERWLYYQFSPTHLYIALWKVGECTFLKLGVKGLNGGFFWRFFRIPPFHRGGHILYIIKAFTKPYHGVSGAHVSYRVNAFIHVAPGTMLCLVRPAAWW